MRTAMNRGFTLVEIMVAMVIGLLVVGAATAVFITSKQSYTTQDSLARLQENARFALQFMARDIRMAGYYGCADDVSSITNTLNDAAGGNPYDTSVPIQGLESATWYPSPSSSTVPTGALSRTDGIAVRYADNTAAVSIDPPYMNTSSAALHTNGTGLNVGDIVMISDCSDGAVFQITGPGSAGAPVTGTMVHNEGNADPGPGNKTKDLGKIFEGDSKAAKLYHAAYFIRDNAAGIPALYRETLAWSTTNSKIQPTAAELVEGIEDMQIRYGVDNANGDKVPDVYLPASSLSSAEWTNVVAVRIGILARTLANTDTGTKQYGEADTKSGYDVDGDGVNDFAPSANDRYQRRVFYTTVVLRNRQ